ncbi:MAG TPA: ATP-dependent DNA helicase RecG, partial [Saprospiraceae bacterium]|nr:ATP-dependent DNA helicase RecG [Saprospiraceae bacterium]
MLASKLDSPIEYLKGVGPAKGDLLRKELSIFTFRDLLFHFPFRYVDKTKFHQIRGLSVDSGEVQLRGILRQLSMVGEGRKKRLVGKLRDATGVMELVWFQGIHYLERSLEVGKEYIAFGKVSDFNGSLNIPHPEMEAVTEENVEEAATFSPVYPSTEKLNSRGLDSKGRRKLVRALLDQLASADVPENLPDYLNQKLRLPDHFTALQHIHFPRTQAELDAAVKRLKFEELFFLQLRLLRIKRRRRDEVRGFVFEKVGDYFNRFFKEKLPFELTGA